MDTEHGPTGNPWGLEPLLDVGELAAYLGVPVSTVYFLREVRVELRDRRHDPVQERAVRRRVDALGA